MSDKITDPKEREAAAFAFLNCADEVENISFLAGWADGRDHERQAQAALVGEREPISHAEFARFVQEARDQRQRAEEAEVQLAAERQWTAALREALTRLLLSYEGFVRAVDRYDITWENLPAVWTARQILAAASAPDAGREGKGMP